MLVPGSFHLPGQKSSIPGSVGDTNALIPGHFPGGQRGNSLQKDQLKLRLGALNATLWNRKQAATLLNVDYKALLYKMKKFGIGNKAARASA